MVASVTVQVGSGWLAERNRNPEDWRARAYLLAIARFPTVSDVRVLVLDGRASASRPPVVHVQTAGTLEAELRGL